MRVLTTSPPNPTYRDEYSGSSRRASYDDDPLLQCLGHLISLVCPSLSSAGRVPHLSPVDRLCGPWVSGGFGDLGARIHTVL